MFQSIADGAFLNPNAWQGSLRWAMPLFITACGVVVSFRSGYFNVGAQGQFYIGAIGATFIVDFLNGYPAALVVPLAFVAGNRRAARSGRLGRVTCVCASGADEVITTLMGNFIASLILIYVTGGILKDPSGTGQVMASRPVAPAYRISSEIGLSPTIVITAFAVGVLTCGCSSIAPPLAFFAASRDAIPTMVVWQGARMSRFGLAAFALAGALAGLAGVIEVLGPNGQARQRLSADARLHCDPDRAGRGAFGRGRRDRFAVLRRTCGGEPLSACAGRPSRRSDRHHQRSDRALHHRSRGAWPAWLLPRRRAARRRMMEEFLVATLRYGTPLVYVTMAGVLAQRAGVWNLGLEGLMIIGCCASVLGFVQTGSLLFGLRPRDRALRAGLGAALVRCGEAARQSDYRRPRAYRALASGGPISRFRRSTAARRR